MRRKKHLDVDLKAEILFSALHSEHFVMRYYPVKILLSMVSALAFASSSGSAEVITFHNENTFHGLLNGSYYLNDFNSLGGSLSDYEVFTNETITYSIESSIHSLYPDRGGLSVVNSAALITFDFSLNPVPVYAVGGYFGNLDSSFEFASQVVTLKFYFQDENHFETFTIQPESFSEGYFGLISTGEAISSLVIQGSPSFFLLLDDVSVSTIPEPSALAFTSFALAGGFLVRKRLQKRKRTQEAPV